MDNIAIGESTPPPPSSATGGIYFSQVAVLMMPMVGIGMPTDLFA
jgi:hypothetical protein